MFHGYCEQCNSVKELKYSLKCPDQKCMSTLYLHHAPINVTQLLNAGSFFVKGACFYEPNHPDTPYEDGYPNPPTVNLLFNFDCTGCGSNVPWGKVFRYIVSNGNKSNESRGNAKVLLVPPEEQKLTCLYCKCESISGLAIKFPCDYGCALCLKDCWEKTCKQVSGFDHMEWLSCCCGDIKFLSKRTGPCTKNIQIMDTPNNNEINNICDEKAAGLTNQSNINNMKFGRKRDGIYGLACGMNERKV